jgi:hypothetical protein
MQIEHLQHEFDRVQANLADRPILPSVKIARISKRSGSIEH